ncbi:MAG: hypothetical protein ACJ8G4_01915, partial [Burkholderiales bacterium]
MRTAALVLALFGLNACSNAIVGASFNSGAAVGTPASATASGGTVTVVSSSGAAALAGVLAFAAFMDAGDPAHMDMRPAPSFTGPYGWFWTRSVPEL